MSDCCAPIVDPPIVFDPAAFRAAYGTFAGCSDAQLQEYFTIAGTVCWNSVRNPAYCTTGLLATLMNLATAHVAWLFAPRDAMGNPSSAGAAASPIVGRINSASEGSVSVGAEWNGSGSPSEAWWLQSPWGATWWQATAQFRQAVYLAKPTVVPGTLPPAWGYYGRFGRRGGGWGGC
jgi:hypothetical protein